MGSRCFGGLAGGTARDDGLLGRGLTGYRYGSRLGIRYPKFKGFSTRPARITGFLKPRSEPPNASLGCFLGGLVSEFSHFTVKGCGHLADAMLVRTGAHAGSHLTRGDHGTDTTEKH